jgi:hypothetical protein
MTLPNHDENWMTEGEQNEKDTLLRALAFRAGQMVVPFETSLSCACLSCVRQLARRTSLTHSEALEIMRTHNL